MIQNFCFFASLPRRFPWSTPHTPVPRYKRHAVPFQYGNIISPNFDVYCRWYKISVSSHRSPDAFREAHRTRPYRDIKDTPFRFNMVILFYVIIPLTHQNKRCYIGNWIQLAVIFPPAAGGGKITSTQFFLIDKSIFQWCAKGITILFYKYIFFNWLIFLFVV